MTIPAPPPEPGRRGRWSIETLDSADPRLSRHGINGGKGPWLTLLHDAVVVYAETPRLIDEAAAVMKQAGRGSTHSTRTTDHVTKPKVVLGGLGLGTIARRLAGRGCEVIAIEISEDVIALSGPAAEAAGVEVIHGDALSINPRRFTRPKRPAAVWLDVWPNDHQRTYDSRLRAWHRWVPFAEWVGLWPMRTMPGCDGEVPPWA